MKLRPFELALVTIFTLIGLASLFMLSSFNPQNKNDVPTLSRAVSIWGTLNADAVNAVLMELLEIDSSYRLVSYTYHSPESFEHEFVNALADGNGPDLVLLPHEELVANRSRLLPLSYDSHPIRNFRDNYIDGAEIFALQDGIYAYPVAVDPIVMYWNRDILSNKGLLAPPNTWEQIVNSFVPDFVERDFNRNIFISPLAFGTYENINNAFEVLSMLLIQGGTRGVIEQNGRYVVDLNNVAGGTGSPLRDALTFYTNFANPNNELYSWNRSFSNDRLEFVAEKLVLYFGKASEARGIARQNPNLNFDIAEVPQGATANVRRTYGSFYGLSVVRASSNINPAFTVMQVLGNANNAAKIAEASGMAPVHRTTLTSGSNDQYARVAFSSAVVARGWLSPRPSSADDLFKQAVEDIISGRRNASNATADTVIRLRDILQ